MPKKNWYETHQKRMMIVDDGSTIKLVPAIIKFGGMIEKNGQVLEFDKNDLILPATGVITLPLTVKKEAAEKYKRKYPLENAESNSNIRTL